MGKTSLCPAGGVLGKQRLSLYNFIECPQRRVDVVTLTGVGEILKGEAFQFFCPPHPPQDAQSWLQVRCPVMANCSSEMMQFVSASKADFASR